MNDGFLQKIFKKIDRYVFFFFVNQKCFRYFLIFFIKSAFKQKNFPKKKRPIWPIFRKVMDV